MAHHSPSEVIQTLYNSNSSRVELVSWPGPFPAVRKTRLANSDFEFEMSIHLALEKCSTHFPKVLLSNLQAKTICLEYCSKGSLKAEIDRLREPWPPKRVYNFLMQLLIGLNCLHRLNCVHGDIEAYHILLAENYEPKLSGFGNAKLLEGESSTNLAFREDIYRLGHVLMPLVTGHYSTPDPAYLVSKYPHFPATFEIAFTSMLSPHPEKRMSALDLISVLTDQDTINKSFISVIPDLSDSEEWIGNETKQALMELKLELSFSSSVVYLEEQFTGTAFSRTFVNQDEQINIQKRLIRMGAVSESIPREARTSPLDEKQMTQLVREALQLHQALKGHFTVTLTERLVDCSLICGSTLVKSQGVTLPCRHSICSPCLCQLLTTVNEQRSPYSTISCPLCRHPFDPLNNETVMAGLSSELVTLLSEKLVLESVKACPKCGLPFDPDWTGQPRTIKCPKCKRKMCNYCFKSTHLFFGCRKFSRDAKSRTSK